MYIICLFGGVEQKETSDMDKEETSKLCGLRQPPQNKKIYRKLLNLHGLYTVVCPIRRGFLEMHFEIGNFQFFPLDQLVIDEAVN